MKFTTHLELHSQTTRLVEGASHGHGHPSQTGFSPSMTTRSRVLRRGPRPKHPLQITTRTPEGPDFKFELLPLHSPLLGQSLLVSFPPLIDMLKFSGYPYLIRGQPKRNIGDREGRVASKPAGSTEACDKAPYARGPDATPPLPFGPVPRGGGTAAQHTSRAGGLAMTLGQACPPECQGAQCAFKDSMIHGILQFTLLIAFRCVLHRCRNQEIRC